MMFSLSAEALRGWLWQLKEDVSAGMEAGFLAGELADFAASEPELALGLEKHPVVQLDGLTTGRQLLQPRDLLQLTAKQLSSYGGSLELACTDLTHYLTGGCRVVVLCGGQVRARNLLCKKLQSEILKCVTPEFTVVPQTPMVAGVGINGL